MAKNNNSILAKQYDKAVSLASEGRDRAYKRYLKERQEEELRISLLEVDEKGRKKYTMKKGCLIPIEYFSQKRFEEFYDKQ
ncbi:MAG: hypothetical protein ABIP51_15185 [Bacteroidia bacterium]